MKKLLLSTVAVCGLAVVASPAMAQVNLELGGWMKGYATYVDNDDVTGTDSRSLDFVRDTEIHAGGETTLDNGLTIGFHTEVVADGGESMDVQESYAYFSGGFGRVNFGAEDGAGYLLQVEAPSADSNYDGIRQFVSPFNFANSGVTYTPPVDYAMDVSVWNDKLTYLSPIMNGFQIGGSYTPDNSGYATNFSVDTEEAAPGDAGSAYELAARYEGMYNNVGVIAGAGYVMEDEDSSVAGADDRTAWNAGLDLDLGAFGVGVAYTVDDYNEIDEDEEKMVVGVDYTTGPFKLGASYMDVENVLGTDGDDLQRLTAGVVYTYGPGMTFRGSISQIDAEDGANDADSTAVLVGTQINF